MPSYVNVEKCDGCKALDHTACEYICPNDLMTLDKDGSVTGTPERAYNREPDMCWECYNCVKTCPQDAIEVSGYKDFTPLGANVIPMRGTDAIMWTVKFRNGNVKRFKFPIRTTPEGSISVFEGYPEASAEGINDQLLFSEPDKMDVERLPTLDDPRAGVTPRGGG